MKKERYSLEQIIGCKTMDYIVFERLVQPNRSVDTAIDTLRKLAE
jgi:hypothetical protein